jgi:hypothetical protein
VGIWAARQSLIRSGKGDHIEDVVACGSGLEMNEA